LEIWQCICLRAQKINKQFRFAISGLLACLLVPIAHGEVRPAAANSAAAAQLSIADPIPQNVRLCLGEQTCEVGDVNGDGRADLIAFVRDTHGSQQAGDVWVSLSNGGWFSRPERWLKGFCIGNQECSVGNVNGTQDGYPKDDIIAFVKDTRGEDQNGQVVIALSNGQRFESPQSAHYFKNSGQRIELSFCIGNEICRVADLNGDTRADLVAFTRDSDPNHPGSVYYAQSITETSSVPAEFKQPRLIKTTFCIKEEECAVGSVDDARGDDLIAFVRDTRTDERRNDVWVYPTTNLSATDTVEAELWHDQFCIQNEHCLVGNIDGAGGDDLIAFGSIEREGEIVNTMRMSLASTNRFGDMEATFEGDFCPANDICKLGDVDGDGRLDVIAFDRGVDTKICASNITVAYTQPIVASTCPLCNHSVPRARAVSSIDIAAETQTTHWPAN